MRRIAPVLALALVAAGCPEECPEDAKMHRTRRITRASLCRDVGGLLVLKPGSTADPFFPSVDNVLPHLATLDATLACLSAEELRAIEADTGFPPPCYHVQLPDGACCGEGIDYFNNLPDPPSLLADVASPRDPCSCSFGFFGPPTEL